MAYVLRKYRDANYKVLKPVRPNVGVEVAFRRRLVEEIEAMHGSVMYWLMAAYRAHRPVMAGVAMDAIPANELRDALAKLSRQWLYRFEQLSDWLADYFAEDAAERSDAALTSALRRAGFTVKFKMTPAMRDILRATVHENVSLIRSIPQQYLTQVEGIIMRSVQTGRDLAAVSRDLQARLGATKDRAALIARDQNNKATSALMRTRQVEMGLEEGVWLHSHAGKEPRPTHLANHGKKFDLKEGWYDPDPRVRRRILPGELINCRCVWKPVVPGLT